MTSGTVGAVPLSRIEAEARAAQGAHGAALARAAARGLREMASRALPAAGPGVRSLRLH